MSDNAPPIGNASRNASDGRYDPAAQPRVCQTCGREYQGHRPSSYCSATCRQRAFRARRSQPVPVASLRRHIVLDVLYECSECGERYLNGRRCENCNRFCARVGAVLPCPHCEEPILLADMLTALGQEVPDRL